MMMRMQLRGDVKVAVYSSSLLFILLQCDVVSDTRWWGHVGRMWAGDVNRTLTIRQYLANCNQQDDRCCMVPPHPGFGQRSRALWAHAASLRWDGRRQGCRPNEAKLVCTARQSYTPELYTSICTVPGTIRIVPRVPSTRERLSRVESTHANQNTTGHSSAFPTPNSRNQN